MKQRIAVFAFSYACLGTIFAGSSYALAMLGKLCLPSQPWLVAPLIVVHFGICWVLTFYRPLGESPWQPVLRVTRILVAVAKAMFGLALALALLTLAAVLWQRHQHGSPRNQEFLAFLLSLLILQTVYTAIYWGVRPENVFSWSWMWRCAQPNPMLVKMFRKKRLAQIRSERSPSSRN